MATPFWARVVKFPSSSFLNLRAVWTARSLSPTFCDGTFENKKVCRRYFAPQIVTNSPAKAGVTHLSRGFSAPFCNGAFDNRKVCRRYFTQLIVESSPAKVQPYLRLARMDKPIGSWLLFLPCAWSLALATPAGHLPDVKLLALFGLGSILMRGAGCTINDLWDKNFDKQVERTKTRPIASGQISEKQAIGFLALQLFGALNVLLPLNLYSIVLAASSLGFVATYPLAKRVTYWPQLVLGLTFNWGAMVGWSAVHGSLSPSVVLPLYAACVSWTLLYDTIYAHQDKEDDVKIGVKSTALLFGDNTKKMLRRCASLSVMMLMVTGVNADQGLLYYGALLGVAAHLVRQVDSVDLNDPTSCLNTFKSNKWLGIFFFFGIVLSTLAQGIRGPRLLDETTI